MGVLVFVLPFLLYFYMKGALDECIYGTLLYNMEYANSRKSWLFVANIKDILQYLYNYFISIIIFLSAFIALLKKENKLAFLYCATGLLEQFLFLNGDNFIQYPLVCIVQVPFAINSLRSLKDDIKPLNKLIMKGSSLIMLVFLIVNMIVGAKAISFRQTFKDRTARGWEELIEQIPESEKDEFVAYGGNDFKELYLLEDLMPCYKYFVIQEWHAKLSPETKVAIHDTFASKKAKWILTDATTDNIQDILAESYQLVDNNERYYLFEHK